MSKDAAFQEGQEISLKPLKGEILEVCQIPIGRTRAGSKQSGHWAYSVRLEDGRIKRLRERDIEAVEAKIA